MQLLLCTESFTLSYYARFSQIQSQMSVCSYLHLAQHGASACLFDRSILFKFLKIIVINLKYRGIHIIIFVVKPPLSENCGTQNT